jgi:hypothetical protein
MPAARNLTEIQQLPMQLQVAISVHWSYGVDGGFDMKNRRAGGQ